MGHSAAVRPGQRRLRLVRRADQLRVGGRPRLQQDAVRRVVAGRPARHRQGHHAIPRGHLARDADGREHPAAACRLRPRLHDDERAADEQDAGHDHRSDRGRGPLRPGRPRSAAPLSGEGDHLRQRRRLHLGALRRSVQRRSRQQPRQPGEPRHRDGASLPVRPARADWRGIGSARARGGTGRERLHARHGRLRDPRRRRGRVPPDRRHQRVHRGDVAVGARQGSGCGGSADTGAVRRGRSDPAGGRPARARHAFVEPRDSAARRRAGSAICISTATAGGAAKASACWSRTARCGRARSKRP